MLRGLHRGECPRCSYSPPSLVFHAAFVMQWMQCLILVSSWWRRGCGSCAGRPYPQVRQSKFFSTGDEAFIREIVLRLKPLVCLPNDFIVRAGDIADDMFFIHRGKVRVLKDKVCCRSQPPPPPPYPC